MEPQDLKLIMVQGPRSGETLEFKPGSKIRIGRVVRGNNVTVKDDGISSKHLAIEFGSGKWTVEDLDSSNGTFLNSNMLLPNTAVELHENDTIKLGDCTTISVRITMDGQDESVAKPRRNPRRQANMPVTASMRVTRNRKKAEPVENLGLEGGEIENQCKITKNGKGRKKILQEMQVERSEVQIESKVKLEPEEVCEVQVYGKENLGRDVGEMEIQSKVTKKGRGRKKNLQEMPLESSEVSIEGKENLEPMEVCEDQVDGKEKLGPDESLKNSEVQIDGKDVAKVTVAASGRVTRTRSRKNALNLELDRGEMVSEIKITQKGRGRKKNLQEMLPQISEVQIQGKEILQAGEVSQNCEVQSDANENLGPEEESMKNCEVQFEGKENSKSEAAVIGGDAKESYDKVEDKMNRGVKEQVVDVEKMKLGEWFDYMEVYLQKQIMDSTEEMIEEMRRKAERVYKYMIEEKKKMGKL